MKGIGKATIAKLRDIETRGGWMLADDWFARHGAKGNRLPTVFSLGLMESFSLCLLGDRESGRARVCYRLTEKGRELLEAIDE